MITRNMFTFMVAVMLSASAATAATPQVEADYNWTGKFIIGEAHNHIATHTPSRVCIDEMFCAGRSITFGPGMRYNDLTLSACGLILKTQSTKAEFVAALECAGMHPIEQ